MKAKMSPTHCRKLGTDAENAGDVCRGLLQRAESPPPESVHAYGQVDWYAPGGMVPSLLQ